METVNGTVTKNESGQAASIERCWPRIQGEGLALTEDELWLKKTTITDIIDSFHTLKLLIEANI